MKVLFVNGSSHKNGTTMQAVKEMQKVFEAQNIETEVIQLGNKPIQDCIQCGYCYTHAKCVFNDDVNEFIEKAKEAVSENEKVNGEYEDRINTLSNQLKMFRNNAFNALADIGKSIAPELKETLNTLKEFAGKIANFIKENPKLVAFIVKMVAGFAAMNLGMGVANKLLLGPFAKGVGWLYKFGAFKSKGGVFFALKKMFPLASKLFGTFMKIGKFLGGKFIGLIKIVGTALKVAFTANPIGMIIVAIIAVIGIFVVLYKKCEWFRNMVNAVWNAIKNAFSSTWQWIKDKFNALLEIGSNAWNGLKNSATAIIDKIREAFSGFFDWLSKKWESIKNFGSKLNPFNWFKGDGEVAQNYSGTNYFGGGLTTLAERGAELVEMNNRSFLVNSPAMANLPRGARILNNSQTRSSLSSRVSSLKDRIRSISNDSRTIVGGDTITININGGSGSASDIAREVKRVIEEMQSKKRRTAIV